MLRDTPASAWSAGLVVMPDTQPVFACGAVFYADGDTGMLTAVDFHTGSTMWSVGAILGGQETPLLSGGVLYVATDAGELFAVNPVTGALLWNGQPVVFAGSSLTAPAAGLGYLASTGQPGPVVYLMDEENVYLVAATGLDGDPPPPATVFSASGAIELGDSLTYDSASGHMILNTARGLCALEADLASADPWTACWSVDLGGPVTAATLAMGTAFVGTPAQTLALVDTTIGAVISSSPLGSTLEQAVSVDVPNNAVYVPTDSGTIFRLDATSAAQLDSFQPGIGSVTTQIVQSDGVAYYGSADQSVYAFDLADAGGTVVSLTAGEPVTCLAGVSSGTTYFATGQTLQACTFADLIHEFNSQSQLMVDFVGTQTTFEQVPAYQTNVSLYDPEGNVRPNESVKVWASAPVTLMTGNQSYAIAADTPAAFQADANGHVVLSVAADTDISAAGPSGLSTAALTLWASFMDPGERILVYPDQRLHAWLQSIGGEELQQAVTYDQSNPGQPGPPLLPAGFQGADGLANAQALASAINNIIVLAPPPGSVGAAGAPNYLAYPQTMLGVSYAPTPPDTGRPALAGAVPNWSLSLSGATGASFAPIASSEEAGRTAAALRGVRAAAGSPVGSIFSDMEDFVANVINGAEAITETVWQAGEQVVNAVIHTTENEYDLAVASVEDAAQVVLGLLVSVLDTAEGAVERVVQALSFLFDWSDILVTHTHVKALINDGFGQASTLSGTLEAAAGDFFDRISTTITGDFSGVIGSISTQGTLAEVVGSTDPNQVYTTNGSDNYSVQGNWLYHKTMTNSVATNGPVSVGSVAADPVQTVAQAMAAFLENVGADALQVAEDLGVLVVAALEELRTMLLVGAGSAGGTRLADLLVALESLLVEVVKLAKDAAEDFIGLVSAVLTSVEDMLNATIDVPFVSWLYQNIAGDDLSILDLFALIVAVPITVMCKALTGQAPFPSQPLGASPTATRLVALPGASVAAAGATLNIESMIWTFNALIYMFIDCASNAMGSQSPSFLSYGQGVSGTISQGLSVPSGGTGDEDDDWGLLWLYQFFAPFWNVHCGMELGAGRTTSNIVLPTWGIGSAIWQAVYAGMYPSEYFDDGIRLTQNEVGCLSTIAGFAKESSNPDVLAALVCADFVLDAAGALIEIKYWWD